MSFLNIIEKKYLTYIKKINYVEKTGFGFRGNIHSDINNYDF